MLLVSKNPYGAWSARGKPVPESVQRHASERPRELLRSQWKTAGGGTFDLGAGKAAARSGVRGCMIVLADVRSARDGEILRNWSASLVDIGDGVGCVEFHSALQPEFNPIDGAVLDMLQSVTRARHANGALKGLVISHDGTHFCAGANLALILELAGSGQFESPGTGLGSSFQEMTQAIKYAPFPVVAAPFSMCLGGGFELIAASRKVVPLAELYCGAVEVGSWD